MSNNVFISPQDNNVSLSTNNNILVITDSDQNQITVSQPVTNVIQVNTIGPQGTTGQQGIQGPTGSLSSTNSGSFAITGSLNISGSVNINGTASINVLVVNQTQLSTGSNQLGDAVNDTQTLFGTVRIPTGSLTVTGSTNITGSLTVIGGITGSLFGTASYTPTLDQVTTAGAITTAGIIYSGSSEALKPSIDSVAVLGALNLRFGTIYGRAVSSANNSLDLIGSNINLNDSSGNIKLKVFGSTGNVTIQNGGTHTDVGFRLDISGSTRITNGLTITGSVLIEQNNPINFGNQVNIQRSGTNILYGSSVETIVNTISTSSPVRFQIGSSEVARITGSFFGIGTTTPQRLLHVDASGSVNTDTPLLLTSVDTNNRVGIRFASSSLSAGRQHTLFHRVNGPTVEWLLSSNAGESAIWRFQPRDDSNYALTILTPYNGGTTSITTGISQSILAIGAGTTNQPLNISSSGDIGIGTTSPQSKLHVVGGITGSSTLGIQGTTTLWGNLSLYGGNNNTSYALEYNYTGSLLGKSNVLHFRQGGNTPGAIMFTYYGLNSLLTLIPNDFNTAKVGVNTPNPSATLHISGSSGSALLRVDSDASSNILFISGSGAVGIGSTGSAGVTLDVNGNIGIASTSTGAGINYLTVSSGRAQFGWSGAINSSYVAASDITKNISFVGDANLTNIWGKFSALSGDFIVQGFTGSIDNRYRLQIYSTGSDSGSLFIGGTNIASGSIARTMLISSSLSASANGDTLVGLDINPTFTAGVFTGVQQENLVIRGGTTPILRFKNAAGTTIYGQIVGTPSQLSINAQANLLSFVAGNTEAMNIFASTRNVLLQNGGTFTDNGYRLDVSGSARITNGLLVSSSITSSGPIIGQSSMTISNNSAIFGSLNIGSFAVATSKLQVIGTGTTSATTTFLLQNATPTTLMTVLDNGQFIYTSPTMSLAASQSAYIISPIISASNIVGGQFYGVNITPTFWQTTGSQIETAFRVAATFTQSSAAATSGSNIIADFGATSVGSQLTITDVTSGSIYMVNDVSGLPIIEATSDWTVNMYNFPNIVFQKTGSNVNITGSLRVTGSLVMSPTSSFNFPLSQSASPLTGSAYWSGSLLFIWDGSRYRSSSFA